MPRLLPKLVEARTRCISARLDLAGELAKGGDGRARARPPTCSARRSGARPRYKAGAHPARELFAGEAALLGELAGGLALDQWVGVWDKLAPLAGQVERLNLDPAQALLQVLQAICGAAPEPELSLA